MYVIGISAFYHDSSVCLFKNGELIFSCEEEKFTGIKHDSSFPKTALSYILKKYRIKRSEIECVCYYENPKLKLERVKRNIKKIFFNNPLHSIKTYLKIKKNISVINYELNKISDNIFFSTHHESHVYYSFYSSDFKDSMVLSVDGVGEIDTMSMGIFRDNKLMYTSLSEYPHSLGLFYSAMTSYLGFKPNEGEYKLMGLASYGRKSKYIELVSPLVKFDEMGLVCDMNKFCWDRDNKLMFNENLIEHLQILPRDVNEPLTIEHKNLAYAVQFVYEKVLFDIINYYGKNTKSENLCLSGGCAYNGTANGKVQQKTKYKKLWIPSAPSDAGSCIGACINYLNITDKSFIRVTRNPFLGPEYGYRKVLETINEDKIQKFNNENKLLDKIAEELAEGKVVGWFYGNIEFGARALGNRSILAAPFEKSMKDKINRVIKKREGFRPFAPMVTQDVQNKYFETFGDVPYMNQVVKVKKEYKTKLGAVTHVDGTARIQTIFTSSNNRIFRLLKKFEKLTGYPILLNTSFNVKDKTIVLTPEDAVATFYDTEMDLLVLGHYLIYK